jgi:Tfp pilus assembly protein PilZ
LARRRSTLDPILSDLRTQITSRLLGAPPVPYDAEKRKNPRLRVNHPARIRIDDLIVRGQIQDVGAGGMFVRTDVLVEVGEKGAISLVHENGVLISEEVPVRVIWTCNGVHPNGAGLGLAFEVRDPALEKKALELVLAVVSESPT